MPEICLATNESDHCSYGALFTVDHSLSCPTGGYPTIEIMKFGICGMTCCQICAMMFNENHYYSLSTVRNLQERVLDLYNR